MRVKITYLFFVTFSIVSCFNQTHAQVTFTLQQALVTARENNPILRTELFNVSIAQADIVSAKLRPNLILNNQTLQNGQPSHLPGGNVDFSSGQSRQVWWQLTKPFQIAGQRSYQIDFANENVSLAQKNYLETERTIFSGVAAKWLEVWAAQKQLEIIDKAKNNIQSLVETNQLRYKNQMITQTDVFRSELLLKQYELQSNTVKQEIANRLTELKFLLGVQEDMTVDMKDDFLFAIPDNVDSLYNQSLNSRSDIGVMKSIIEVSKSNIKLQRSLAYPQPELGVIWNPQNNVPYYGIYATVRLPVFDRNQGEIKKSFLLKEKAEKELYTIQTKLQSEITVAIDNYRLRLQNIDNFKILLDQSQTILDNVKYSYLKGGTTIIDFLEAQRSWLDTQQQYYDALQQYRLGYVQLLYTTGLISQLAK
ncbi:TolC family protein [uncultured Cytophaga sp.]|uniref:TolC family protein n=1 Tax=uncultured Cytophaga sp. TaxID=160238 RepID=UPI00262B484A|nr:TolC family protein [uncultured Cytophaga sp.]